MSQPDPWADYALLQEQADRPKTDAKSWAAEEQANQFLDALSSGYLQPDPEARRAWLENLSKNRARKHRRRAWSLRLNQHFWPISTASVAQNRAEAIEAIDRIKSKTTNDEWAALIALSNGASYEAVAAENHCSRSALKTRISRCRKRLAQCA